MKASPRAAFGASIRAGRLARGWTQRELAGRAGLPQAVIWAIEAGDGALVESLERVCGALDGELRLEARLPFAGSGPRQTDLGHARCIGAVRRLLEASGYTCATEQVVVDGPWRGFVDLLGFDAIAHRLVLVEIKTELRDAGALERQVERYASRCLDVARRLGWRVQELAVVVLVLATADADAFLIANREAMAGAFPVRGREGVGCVLDRGTIRGRVLLMLDPLRRGRRALGRARVDGRRTAAPYRDYGSFVASLGRR